MATSREHYRLATNTSQLIIQSRKFFPKRDSSVLFVFCIIPTFAPGSSDTGRPLGSLTVQFTRLGAKLWPGQIFIFSLFLALLERGMVQRVWLRL